MRKDATNGGLHTGSLPVQLTPPHMVMCTLAVVSRPLQCGVHEGLQVSVPHPLPQQDDAATRERPRNALPTLNDAGAHPSHSTARLHQNATHSQRARCTTLNVRVRVRRVRKDARASHYQFIPSFFALFSENAHELRAMTTA